MPMYDWQCSVFQQLKRSWKRYTHARMGTMTVKGSLPTARRGGQATQALKPFHSVAGELSTQDGLLMRGSRIVIPTEMRKEVLVQLHAGHQGISKCRLLARQSVWWPGMSSDIEKMVKTCTECIKCAVPQVEPLLSSPMPTLPWQKVATDLFEWKGAVYLLIIDYFSRWIEIARMEQTTSNKVVQHMKSIFARYGIPEVVVSDNGPQYSSALFSQFANTYGFKHITSSPHYPQANGEAERAVRTIKGMLKKAQDPYLALLTYRSTPTAIGFTPAELLMSCKLRTTVQISRELRVPTVPDYSTAAERDHKEKLRQAEDHNRHHAANELPTLEPGDVVFVRDRQETGIVQGTTAPRSYLVDTPRGTFRRNRCHVVPLPEPETESAPTSGEESGSDRIEPNSSTGPVPMSAQDRYPARLRKPPERLDISWH